MTVAGRALYRFNQWRESRPYQAMLRNGSDVFRQKLLDDAGSRETIIDGLQFKDGHNFKVRDGAGAAHIFYEIFLRDQYPRDLLQGSSVIVDVGANIGLFSYYARRHAPGARILAMEADPDTFAVLESNMSGLQVDLFHQAAASTPGTIDFYSSETSGWSSRYPVLGAADGRKVSVRAEPLSATLRGNDRIDFLKIDIEGAEYDVLLGDTALWEIPIGTLIVEADRTPRDPRYSMNDMVIFLRDRFRSVLVGTGNYPLITCRN